MKAIPLAYDKDLVKLYAEKMFPSPKLFLMGMVMLLFCCKAKEVAHGEPQSTSTALNELSEAFLRKVKAGVDTEEIQKQLADLPLEELDLELQTDAQRYAFWINVYNAYILVVLREQPELYNDKNDFFSKEQLKIAGRMVSFETIEHGILRKSQWSMGLGYVRKWFPKRLERILRVNQRDYRIHFALNCGAKDCPPVDIYSPTTLEEQLNKGTSAFLKKTTEYEPDSNTILVTPLFSWFRGDFGGKSGIRKIIKEQGLLPYPTKTAIVFKDYDWTLDLDNFIDQP